MKYKDDRTTEEQSTHNVLITATDKCNWHLPYGSNKCAWACRPEDADVVWRWVLGRSDMKYVNVTHGEWKPRNAGAVHIYRVGPNHPALNQ